MSRELVDDLTEQRRSAPVTPAQVARLAHDLRAPLAAVRTAAELACEDLDRLDADQLRKMVVSIRRATGWLEQLVENLLVLTAAPEGDLPMHQEALDLRDVIAEIQPAVLPVLGARGQTLQVVEPWPLPPVVGDRQQLGRVCINLIANAAKFADAGTTIKVVLTRCDDYARVAVQDRGPGIPDQSLPYLFEAFYQAPSPAAQQGVGLGLAIVQTIVAAHGGRVGASNRRGGGARVWFELPLAARCANHG